MPSLIKHKRVEFTELFYDLVFVYAISKTTALIHHLHHGVLTWSSIWAFLLALLILVNSWMIQTVFTNRYGKNSLFNILIMFTNMGILLFISNMITNDWEGYFATFCWAVGSLTLTLFLQYLAEYSKKSHSPEAKDSMRSFLVMTGLRTLALYIAALMPMSIGVPIYAIGIIGTFVMPLIFTKGNPNFGVNMPHLIERVSLLVIITFGEMIMGIANFFTPENFTFNSVFFFLMMAAMFLYYFGQFDHAIDETADAKGLFLIYSHYPIFIGLIMTTVSMSFLMEHEANHLFVVAFLYVGLFLFQWAVLANSKFNKDYLRLSRNYYLVEAGFFLAGLILSLIFAANFNLVIIITTVMLIAIQLHFAFFYTSQSRKHKGNANWDLI
ncbi:low temperature requirement protein A [Streptococcus macacae]|uniref:Low temperature requirement protein LtrA n=1 Tax=Streptococcus macacae NCTC 11558 TaxID=764298 RepID=G5JUM7_9STRE|nr:low temperature requirement protein A [Streptococcus macacae]EHJ51570.1 low temperature requirement protein LtrA [Streptococcus macacae NCTC 11558]